MKTVDKDTYKTQLKPTEEVLYKDRNSKFYGYAFPLTSEAEVGALLGELATRHRKASHLCYAWQWGVQQPYHRVNDDGEPTHSAGTPIYGQIQSFGLTNVLLAVIRIYGGTKLGVGGLIQAYRETAKMALDSAEIITKTLQLEYELNFDYPKLHRVLKILKHPGVTVVKQEMQQRCTFHIAVRHQKAEKTEELIRNIPGVSITKYSL